MGTKRFTGSWRRRIAALLVSFSLLALGACAGQTPPTAVVAQSDIDKAETSAPSALEKEKAPQPDMSLVTPEYTARRILDSMTLQERVGQLVMAPINIQTSTSLEQLQSFVRDGKVGSVLLLGNWSGGVTQLASLTEQMQGFAPKNRQLLIAADQEGGQVQHLQGAGFSRMPSAVWQGSQTTDYLQQLAQGWGQQLKSAGVTVNLAPVTDTVQVQRPSNAPVGALSRDFGHDGTRNAEYAAAFIRGMRAAGVSTSIKHYPGLGAVTGNTDFTAQGIVDTTTVLGGDEEGAFVSALAAAPEMVMMSLATYSAIDPDHPAVFSSALITDRLRSRLGFEGVVTSDSLSAAAVRSIPAGDLGVRFVSAGGDLVCVGEPGIAQQILDGLNAEAQESADFRALVDRSALRVLTLKVEKGLAAE